MARHNTLPTPTYYGLVVDLLQTCYVETGVMDFGLYKETVFYQETVFYEIVVLDITT